MLNMRTDLEVRMVRGILKLRTDVCSTKDSQTRILIGTRSSKHTKQELFQWRQ